MKYKDIYIATNAVLEGHRQKHEAWEFKMQSLGCLSGTGMVCVTCRVALPKKYSWIRIAYCEDIRDFIRMAENEAPLVYSCFFIPCTNLEAENIITDIMDKHPKLKRWSAAKG